MTKPGYQISFSNADNVSAWGGVGSLGTIFERFVGPKVCLGLLSDSTSRWTPLPSAMGLSLPTALGTFTR